MNAKSKACSRGIFVLHVFCLSASFERDKAVNLALPDGLLEVIVVKVFLGSGRKPGFFRSLLQQTFFDRVVVGGGGGGGGFVFTVAVVERRHWRTVIQLTGIRAAVIKDNLVWSNLGPGLGQLELKVIQFFGHFGDYQPRRGRRGRQTRFLRTSIQVSPVVPHVTVVVVVANAIGFNCNIGLVAKHQICPLTHRIAKSLLAGAAVNRAGSASGLLSPDQGFLCLI